MPATVTSSNIIAAKGVEVVKITDDYGTVNCLTIPFSDSANRAARIAAQVAVMDANEAALQAYAAANGLTPPAKG